MREPLSQRLAMAVQFAISCIVGGAVFLALADDPNPKVPLFGGAICGLAAAWLATWLWAKAAGVIARLRHGCGAIPPR